MGLNPFVLIPIAGSIEVLNMLKSKNFEEDRIKLRNIVLFKVPTNESERII